MKRRKQTNKKSAVSQRRSLERRLGSFALVHFVSTKIQSQQANTCRPLYQTVQSQQANTCRPLYQTIQSQQANTCRPLYQMIQSQQDTEPTMQTSVSNDCRVRAATTKDRGRQKSPHRKSHKLDQVLADDILRKGAGKGGLECDDTPSAPRPLTPPPERKEKKRKRAELRAGTGVGSNTCPR